LIVPASIARSAYRSLRCKAWPSARRRCRDGRGVWASIRHACIRDDSDAATSVHATCVWWLWSRATHLVEALKRSWLLGGFAVGSTVPV
jgi:hypothetical protein